MNFWKYTWYNTLGSLPKMLIFEVAGYYFGKSYEAINQYLNYAAAISFVILVGSFGIYYAIRRNQKNKNKELKL